MHFEALLCALVIEMKFLFTVELLSSLDAVNGRKHPNALQSKQLKDKLPLINIILHLVTSPVCYSFI